MQEIKSKGITQIVQWMSVEQLTKKGWNIIGMYQETGNEPCNDTIPDSNGGYQGAILSVTKHLPHTETFFILELDAESSLVDMNATIKKQEEEIKGALIIQKAQTEKVAELTEERDKFQGIANHKEDQREEYAKKYSNTLTIKNNMEADIGKIEKAIGTQKMKEILEEK